MKNRYLLTLDKLSGITELTKGKRARVTGITNAFMYEFSDDEELGVTNIEISES